MVVVVVSKYYYVHVHGGVYRFLERNGYGGNEKRVEEDGERNEGNRVFWKSFVGATDNFEREKKEKKKGKETRHGTAAIRLILIDSSPSSSSSGR